MNAKRAHLRTVIIMGTSADGFIVMVSRKTGLCIVCDAKLNPGTTVSWHPTRRQLRCREHEPSTRLSNFSVEFPSGSHSNKCLNISPEHLIDLITTNGHRALENRRKLRSTTTFDQIFVLPTGIIVVEHLDSLDLESNAVESTIAAKLLRKVDSIQQVISDEFIQVSAVAIVNGLDRTYSLFGITLTGKCAGWMFPTEGPLSAEQISRVTVTIGSAFPSQ